MKKFLLLRLYNMRPYLFALGLELVNAALAWTGTLHLATPEAAAALPFIIYLGHEVDTWLSNGTKANPIQNGPGAIGVATVAPGMIAAPPSAQDLAIAAALAEVKNAQDKLAALKSGKDAQAVIAAMNSGNANLPNA
jgi:hypothetical protein